MVGCWAWRPLVRAELRAWRGARLSLGTGAPGELWGSVASGPRCPDLCEPTRPQPRRRPASAERFWGAGARAGSASLLPVSIRLGKVGASNVPFFQKMKLRLRECLRLAGASECGCRRKAKSPASEPTVRVSVLWETEPTNLFPRSPCVLSHPSNGPALRRDERVSGWH